LRAGKLYFVPLYLTFKLISVIACIVTLHVDIFRYTGSRLGVGPSTLPPLNVA
jgi:hypothetical protein